MVIYLVVQDSSLDEGRNYFISLQQAFTIFYFGNHIVQIQVKHCKVNNGEVCSVVQELLQIIVELRKQIV
jgi:hypothetical protein